MVRTLPFRETGALSEAFPGFDSVGEGPEAAVWVLDIGARSRIGYEASIPTRTNSKIHFARQALIQYRRDRGNSTISSLAYPFPDTC